MVFSLRTLWMLGFIGGTLHGSVARAADADALAELRYLLATGRADEVARRTAGMLIDQPGAPELVMLQARAVAALGEGRMLVDAIDGDAGGAGILAHAGAAMEGLADGEPHCEAVLAAVEGATSKAEWRAYLQVRTRVVDLCGVRAVTAYEPALAALEGSVDALALQVGSAGVAWGSAVEAWAETGPRELVRAGNPWSDAAAGLGLVKARVALAAAAERAAMSDDPVQVWSAREVWRWQGLDTTALDERLTILDSGAREVDWHTGAGIRWQDVSRPDHAALAEKMARAETVRDLERRRELLELLGAQLPVTGPLRADWWMAMAELLEQEGRLRAHVRALESAWRADTDHGGRANAFAWSAARYQVRMSVALEAIDAAIAAPMSYDARRGGPAADGAFRWSQGHTLGSWLDTRGWLRLQMGDTLGARADFDQALMLYRSPSATVHFHAALAAEQDGLPEVALFHLREGFAVVDARYDKPELVQRARALVEALYARHRWHPDGVDGWLEGRARSPTEASGGGTGAIVELDATAARLNGDPLTLPVQGGLLPSMVFEVDGQTRQVSDIDGWRVIELWAEWCAPCQLQLGSLAEFHAELRSRDIELTVIVLSVEAQRRVMWSAPLPPGWVRGWSGPKASELLGAAGLPATLLVDPQGRVVETRMGWEGDLEWLERAVSEHW